MQYAGWIDEALLRLETLEHERVHLVGHPAWADTLAEYDEEIAALYEVLEAEAGAETPDDTGAPVAVPVAITTEVPTPLPLARVPAGVPSAVDENLGTLTFIANVGWTTIDDLPPMEPLAPSPISNLTAMDYDIEEPFDRGGSKWLLPVAAILVAAVCTGLLMAGGSSERLAEPPPQPQPATPMVERSALVAAAPVAAEPEQSEEAAALAKPISKPATSKKARRSHRKSKRRRAARRSKKPDRKLALGSGRDPLSGL